MEPAQALADLDRLGELVKSRQPGQVTELEQMHRSYLEALPPKKGAAASLAYRLRLLFLDRWNLWSLLTRYRKWRGPNQEQLDGTNNACERLLGGGSKSATVRCAETSVRANAVRVSRLLAWCGNFLDF